MTTPYGISTSIGSQTFQGYVNAPILGPLNSSQYPNLWVSITVILSIKDIITI
jgi:hypothetical protein